METAARGDHDFQASLSSQLLANFGDKVREKACFATRATRKTVLWADPFMIEKVCTLASPTGRLAKQCFEQILYDWKGLHVQYIYVGIVSIEHACQWAFTSLTFSAFMPDTKTNASKNLRRLAPTSLDAHPTNLFHSISPQKFGSLCHLHRAEVKKTWLSTSSWRAVWAW